MKNCSTTILILVLIMLCSCKRTSKYQFDIHKIYTASRAKDTFEVHFLERADTVFLTYFFVYDNGNYINTPDDPSDYAGYFLKKDINSNTITFSIKNYREYWRDSSQVYDLKLTFLSDSTFEWKIDSNKYGIFNYLPNNIVFTAKE